MERLWKPVADSKDLFGGHDRKTGSPRWTATRADLIFGSNSELRALAEVVACEDAKGEICEGFCGGMEQGDEFGQI